ncbi:MAG: hypothetical protein KBS96_00860 [Lachnospiraceae bacterium]|nr:hypothetical protein [Candidatus Colinaster scatohippi]
MRKLNEYKISIALFSIALVLYVISIITGLIPGLAYSIDKMCMHLGIVFFGFGLVFSYKPKNI